MLKHTIGIFAIGLACLLVLNSDSAAQPGKGKGGPDAVKSLQAELEKLREQIKEVQAKLAKASTPGAEFGRGGCGRGGFGPGGFGPGKGDEFYKKGGGKAFGPAGKDGPKMDPATVTERYEFYKKLYDALPKEKGKGKGFEGKGKGFEGKFKGFEGKGKEKAGPGASSIDARLDRLMREIEDLRKELRK